MNYLWNDVGVERAELEVLLTDRFVGKVVIDVALHETPITVVGHMPTVVHVSDQILQTGVGIWPIEFWVCEKKDANKNYPKNIRFADP